MNGEHNRSSLAFPESRVGRLLESFCSAPDWPLAADVLARSDGALLDETATELALRTLEQYKGREFEQIPHRLNVLLSCRRRAPGDVLLPRVTSDLLGPLAHQVLKNVRQASDAETVVEACTTALAGPAAARPDVRAFLLGLRAHAAFMLVHTQDGVAAMVADLSEAQAVLTRVGYPEHWIRVTQALGECLRRLEAGDRAANLERCIRELEALRDHLRGTRVVEEANALNSLGDAYGRRVVGDPAENQAQANILLREAFELFAEIGAREQQAGVARNIAGLTIRMPTAAPYKGIVEAFRWSQLAEESYAASGLVLEVGRTRADLGVICARYAQEQEVTSFYGHAVDLIRSSYEVDWSSLDRKDFAVSHMGLGACLLKAAETDEGRREAVSHFTEALRYLDPLDVAGHAAVLNNRGLAHLQLGDLEGAAADLVAAVELSGRELSEAGLIEQQLAVVGRMDELHGTAALVLVRLGRHQEALDMVERGRARLLARSLGPRPAEEVDASLADGVVIVVPVVTDHGSVLLVVPPGTKELSAANVVRVDTFDSAALRRITVGTRQGAPGWLMRRLESDLTETPDEYEEATRRFAEAIDESLVNLGEYIGGPIADCLDSLGVTSNTTVALLADGELAVTPLHAVPLLDGSTLLDRWDVVYSPSVSVLRLSTQRARGWRADGVNALLIADPTGTLPNAEVELSELRRRLPSASRTMDTSEELSTAYAGEDIVHIACHGVHDWRAVDRSYLEMYPDRVVTSEEISTYPLAGCRLAVLSACETGMTNFIQAKDEFLGLPTAFLRAGAAAVVCTLWQVDDLATSLFMHRFYDALIDGKAEPARALREAAAWLRDAPVRRLLHETSFLDEETRSRLSKLPMDSRAFAEPFFWAGFVLLGM